MIVYGVEVSRCKEICVQRGAGEDPHHGRCRNVILADHHLRPAQARAVAAALVRCAGKAERRERVR
jgi:hypothetical protein